MRFTRASALLLTVSGLPRSNPRKLSAMSLMKLANADKRDVVLRGGVSGSSVALLSSDSVVALPVAVPLLMSTASIISVPLCASCTVMCPRVSTAG